MARSLGRRMAGRQPGACRKAPNGSDGQTGRRRLRPAIPDRHLRRPGLRICRPRGSKNTPWAIGIRLILQPVVDSGRGEHMAHWTRNVRRSGGWSLVRTPGRTGAGCKSASRLINGRFRRAPGQATHPREAKQREARLDPHPPGQGRPRRPARRLRGRGAGACRRPALDARRCRRVRPHPARQADARPAGGQPRRGRVDPRL